MKHYHSIFFLLLISLTCCSQETSVIAERDYQFDRKQEISTISFGSCNKHTKDQPLWKSIIENEPSVWIWLGDIIYGDTENMDQLRKKYAVQKEKEEYQALLKYDCDIIGVYDDHDYGKNNAGKEYPRKKESREVLFEFLDVPADDKARKHEGAYNSFEYGVEGEMVKVILLDARYFRDKPGKKSDVLGKEQWAWLEKELEESTAQIHIIGSGIQIIPNQHKFEKWGKFPKSRKKLFDLLVKKETPGVIFITGDRHIGEISKIEWPNSASPFYEITSSGMTHFYGLANEENNDNRIGKLVKDYNFGLINIDWKLKELELQIRGPENMIHETTKVNF